jgi:hypothetical protein
MLQQFHSNRMTAKAGGTMFGADSARWPAWWADAIELLNAENALANSIQGIKD